MRRRGFTMLELVLATMVGAMVLAAALGIFSSMERGDTVLGKRAKENNGLEMASLAIERAVSTLVMETGGQAGGTKTEAARGADGTDPKPQSVPTGRARFILETDTTAGLPGMPDVAQARDGSAGSAALLAGSLSSPQRLELVVARHPMPVTARPATIVPVSEKDDPKNEGNGSGDPTDNRPVAVRGAFDLRPEPVRPGAENAGTTWTLWWRPIERRVDGTGAEAFAGADDLAVPLATGLKSCRWSVYYEETWETSHATAAVLDLPAYIKLQVTTATGLQADWLFEVAWSMGPEFKETKSEEDEAEDGGKIDEQMDDLGTDARNTATVPDATGQQRPRTTTPNGPPKRVKPGAVKPPSRTPTAPRTPGKPGTPSKSPDMSASPPPGTTR